MNSTETDLFFQRTTESPHLCDCENVHMWCDGHGILQDREGVTVGIEESVHKSISLQCRSDSYQQVWYMDLLIRNLHR